MFVSYGKLKIILVKIQKKMSKYSLFPIQDDGLWDLYKHAVASFWTVEEVDLVPDRKSWAELNDSERDFIKTVLSFFAVSDGLVNSNLLMNFANEVEDSASQCFYGFQIAIENIHAEMYALLIEAYVQCPQERLDLFDGITNNESIEKKADWCLKYTDRSVPFQERLVAFAIVEGVFFSASFASIFWLKSRGLMPGLCFSNELISRDEALHTRFAVAKYFRGEALPEAKIHEIMGAAVNVEIHFVNESLQVPLIGMNANQMVEYVKFVADYLLVQLGVAKLYNAQNPFGFMELISLSGKTNFFERRVSEYSKAGVGVSVEDQQFSLDTDF